MAGRTKKEGCGNSPLTLKEIYELALWGASCYQDDFLYLLDSPEKHTAKELREYEHGYEICAQQINWLQEQIKAIR